jgi:hypothetical protein
MIRKSILTVGALGLLTLFICAAFLADPDFQPIGEDTHVEILHLQSSANLCCQEDWRLICSTDDLRRQGVLNNKKRDRNGDNCLCLKRIPGEGNGNKLGPVEGRNWKDNNQPCD